MTYKINFTIVPFGMAWEIGTPLISQNIVYTISSADGLAPHFFWKWRDLDSSTELAGIRNEEKNSDLISLDKDNQK